MTTEFISLPKSALHAINKPLGWRIECAEGTAWVTHDHHPHDILLTSGQCHTCIQPGRVLVQALDSTVIRLHEPVRTARTGAPQRWPIFTSPNSWLMPRGWLRQY
ncbi:DUF2917 domain-containing protein [Hydrogenophaga sp. Root209]|uniref:DUF2917 domain-containing protein n=1 Tax=Hydrogenophaga sp. Root209 TaxID=1736490 RepID=UPI0009EBB2F7|nr:DUF2917 domain-containing protein [Hydrogenophaga sp. Root209]